MAISVRVRPDTGASTRCCSRWDSASAEPRCHAGGPKLEWPRMFGREYGTATTWTGFQRFRKDDPRHSSRDEGESLKRQAFASQHSIAAVNYQAWITTRKGLLMSAFGPKRTLAIAPHMSAFGGKADIDFLARRELGISIDGRRPPSLEIRHSVFACR